jgi:hypothetical protein
MHDMETIVSALEKIKSVFGTCPMEASMTKMMLSGPTAFETANISSKSASS